MKKKHFIVIGLIIILIGGLSFWYVSIKTKENQLQIEQKQQEDALLSFQQEERRQSEQNKKQEETQKQEPKTLDDLLVQAEEIGLLTIDVTNWKTYQNKEIGFEIKLPQNFDDINPKVTENKDESSTPLT
jgi:hypothetical protein